MLLADVAAAVQEVAATSSRSAKARRLAETLRAARTEDLPVVVAYLSGELRQRRTGIGWRTLADRPPPAAEPTLTVHDADETFARAERTSGTGADGVRRDLVHSLFSRATAAEQQLLAALIAGELRQGAAGGVLADAIAVASGADPAVVRRALTLSGSLPEVAVAALSAPDADTANKYLADFGLTVGRALGPMLAQSAPSVADALERTGPAAVEWKLDGIRVQVHRDGEQVRVFTRSLDDITDRVPETVKTVRALPVKTVVADGELIALDGSGELLSARPLPFQQTSSRVATRTTPRTPGTDAQPPLTTVPLTTVLFDLLHLDGTDLLDEPYAVRRAELERVAPGLAVPASRVTAVQDAEQFAADALARGHEGVVVKALEAPYAMGRRGAAWVKVKPRTTFDLVVLAAEWGHGRRTGWLSNLHLGARDPMGEYGPPGGFVMLGKTFKGMTDELLRWQTGKLQEIATGGTRGRVDVRPELVVEIALDGVQTSPRYPAGMALRFARVLRYRPDKTADEADTVDDVRRLHVGG